MFWKILLKLWIIHLVKTPCILIAGGSNFERREGFGSQALTSIEVISGFSRRNIGLPKLPKEITKDTGNYSKTYCSMFIHDGVLMVCGG